MNPPVALIDNTINWLALAQWAFATLTFLSFCALAFLLWQVYKELVQ